ncbi:hypothetical protein D3Z38_01405 [Clostridiales bacterium]|nr:hypothetical protein [Clostridiales bacterium]
MTDDLRGKGLWLSVGEPCLMAGWREATKARNLSYSAINGGAGRDTCPFLVNNVGDIMSDIS